MDRQAIFDRVATHLLTQMVKSMKDPDMDNRCMYRGANGTSCAVGCLIPDDRYEERFEGLTPDSDPNSFIYKMDRKAAAIAFKKMLAEVLGATTEDDFAFLRGLQRIHDFGDQFSWRRDLDRFAELSNLQFCVAV